MRRFIPYLLLVAACSTEPNVPPQPGALQLVTGGGQSGVPGYRLPAQVIVKLADIDGRPVVGDTVTFMPSDLSSALEPAAIAVTDSAGLARVYWRLGGALGSQTLEARVANLPVTTVSATALSNHMQSIDGGYAGLCGVDDQGRLGCWKPPLLHQADVAPTFRPVSAPVQFAMVTMPINVNRSSIANPLTGHGEGCALTTTGRLWCFTLDTLANVSGLAELSGGYPALAQIVSANEIASYCGLSAVGEAWCWGDNSHGQLGDGTHSAHSAPAPAMTSARFVQMDTDNQACAVTADGQAWCWGSNRKLEAGSANGGVDVLTPALVETPLQFEKVRVDASLGASCGFSATAGMNCWGDTQDLGLQNTAAPPTATPIAIATGTQPFDIMVSDAVHFQFNKNASLQWSGTAGFRIATEGGSGGANHLVQSQLINLLRDVQITQGAGFICGTAVLGGATLCPSTVGVIANSAGATMPMIVGVPFP